MPSFFSSILLNVRNLFNKEKTWFWLFGVSVFITSQIRYLTHSEFWSIFYSKFLFVPGNFQESLYSKLFFNASLTWIHWLPLGNMAHLVVARFTFSVVALGILYYTYKILRLRLNLKPTVLVLTFLYLNPLTFWELPQAKADIFSLLVLLMALYKGLLGQRRASQLFFILALFTTPKSIFFIPICLAFLFINERNILGWSPKAPIWIVRALLFLGLVVYYRPGILTTYKMAWNYFTTVVIDGLRKGFYFKGNVYFIELFAMYVLPSLVLMFFYSRFYLKIKLLSKKNLLLYFGVLLWSFICITIYPLKHPYFFIPFWFLLSLLFIFKISPELIKLATSSAGLTRKVVFLILIFPFFGAIHSGLFNIGFNQIKMISKLDEWLQYDENLRVADATGVLPRANNVPQYIEFFDEVALKYFQKTVYDNFPDLFFVTTKVRAKFGYFSHLYQEEFVYVARYLLARKIELSESEIYSGEKIFSRVRQQFNFKPKFISFRAHSRIDENRPILATCDLTQVTKLDWLPEEVKNCRKFSYKQIDWSTKKNLPEVYPVPFPAVVDPLLDLIPLYTNFKDFSLLDRIIISFESH